jgi:transglutaminase-like putative cysteine protease
VPSFGRATPPSGAPERLDGQAFGLLSATVAATLLAHVGHLPAWLSVPLLALVGARWWSRRRGGRVVASWIRLPLAGLLLVLVVMHFGNLFGREPGTMLGCGLLALKLLETERRRDARVALGFAAFVLMSALLFQQSLGFTLLICMVLALLLASLVALQPALPVGRAALRLQLRTGAVLLGASLPLAVAAFVLVPRLASPLWGAPGSDLDARTGLSEEMAPGSMTELLIDDSPALRVDFDGDAPPAPAQRYFRALVMWDFDGTTWRRGLPRSRTRPEEVESAGRGLAYAVTLEPSRQRWLPTLDVPLEAPSGARLSAGRVVVATTRVDQPRQYRLRSASDYRLAPVLDESERMRALALPPGVNARTRALAERWRHEGRDEAGMVQAAFDLYRRTFTYTLQPPLLGRDSVDEFLFDTQRGYCEHFSSSFVFLMRAAGIPARVVTGYQGGWWNATHRYLLVRQSDAHAWAEVWMAGRGWVRLDPTAAVSPTRVEAGSGGAAGAGGWGDDDWLRTLRNQFDVVNRLWTQGVLRFDALRQKGLLTPFGVADARPGDLLLALSAALAVAMVLATLWALRGGPRVRGDALDRAWARLLGRLRRRGIVHRPAEGPLEFLARMNGDAPELAARLAPVIGEYAELRYGARIADAARVAAFARRARRLPLPARRNRVAPMAPGGPAAEAVRIEV